MRGLALVRENMVVQYLLVASVVFTATAIVLAVVLARQIERTVMDDVENRVLNLSKGPLMSFFTPSDFQGDLSEARYQEMDTFVNRFIVSPRTARVKVWNDQGLVVYSTDRSQAGQQFPIKQHLAMALSGGIGRELEVPRDVENERERYMGTLVEIYVPAQFQGEAKPRGAFEVYEYYAPIASQIRSLQKFVYLALGLSFGVVFLALLGIVVRGWQTIGKQRQALEARERQLSGLNRTLQAQINVIYEDIRSAVQQVRTASQSVAGERLKAEYDKFLDKLSALIEGRS